MLMMMLLLLVGVVAVKTGIVDAETNRRLSRFAIVIPQSAIILSSAFNLQMEMTPGKVLGVIGVAFLMYALLTLLGLAVPALARAKEPDRGVFSFLILFGNVAYMGFPLVQALFGSDAVFYAALLNIPFNLLAYTLGVRLIGGSGAGGKMSWRQLVNPPMVASVLAVIIIFLPVKWPGPLVEATSALGDMILPLSMIIIGTSLGEMKLKDVLGDWRVYAVAPVRLLVAPVLLWAAMGLFVKDTLLLNVITLVGATPSAAMAAMMAIQYGRSERLASQGVFITTVLSMATIPLVCWLLL